MIIDVAPDMIPHRRHELPLIDEARLAPVEQDVRRDVRRCTRLMVDIKPDFTSCRTAGRLGLAATTWPLDEHRPGRLQARSQLGVDDSIAI